MLCRDNWPFNWGQIADLDNWDECRLLKLERINAWDELSLYSKVS